MNNNYQTPKKKKKRTPRGEKKELFYEDIFT